MKNFDEYVHFVVGAKIAGQEIERTSVDKWVVIPEPTWNWRDYSFRIKLPKGWEYVIENGDIAFREPKKEYFLDISSEKLYCDFAGDALTIKRPIIKYVKE